MEVEGEIKDGLGFDIIGLREAQTDEEKIKIIEEHIETIDGVWSEAKSVLENRVAQLKYPELNL